MDFSEAMQGLKDILLSKNGGLRWNTRAEPEHKTPFAKPGDYRLGATSNDEILEHSEEQRLSIIPGLQRQSRLAKDEVFWVVVNGGPARFEMGIVIAGQWEGRRGQRGLFRWREHVGRKVTIANRMMDGYDMSIVAESEDQRSIIANGCWWFQVSEPIERASGPFQVAIFE